MLGAVACFACLDASAKWVNRTTDPLQTAAVRYLGSFLLVSFFFNPWTKAGLLRTRSLKLQVARALCLVVATICSFFALKYLRLTEVTSITFASPLVVALLARPILGERIGAHRLAAVLAGFAGVLVVTRPGVGGLHAAALLAVGAACANALYSLTTRLVAAKDASETTLFYTGLVGSLVFLPVTPFVWAWPAAPLTWLLLAAPRRLRRARPLAPDPGPPPRPGLGPGPLLLRPAAVGHRIGLPRLRRDPRPLDPGRRCHRHGLGPLPRLPRAHPPPRRRRHAVQMMRASGGRAARPLPNPFLGFVLPSGGSSPPRASEPSPAERGRGPAPIRAPANRLRTGRRTCTG